MTLHGSAALPSVRHLQRFKGTTRRAVAAATSPEHYQPRSARSTSSAAKSTAR